jgi:hypothetical protein
VAPLPGDLDSIPQHDENGPAEDLVLGDPLAVE